MTSAQTIDGVDVFIEGNGTEAIVMVHGWPDTWRLWDAQVDWLKSSYRCIRFTLPGFAIDKPRRVCSLAELVEFLKRVIEQLCPGDPVTLLLHDWGCIFGYEFTIRHPSLVRRIVGVDVGDAGSAALRSTRTFKAKALVFGYQAWLAAAWYVGGLVSTKLGDRMTRWMARALRCPSEPSFITSGMCYPYFIQWTRAYGSYRGALHFDPPCPMLYLWGRKKPFQFHSQQWVAALRSRPGCDALEFSAGHWVMKNKPLEFNEVLGAWLGASTHNSPRALPSDAGGSSAHAADTGASGSFCAPSSQAP